MRSRLGTALALLAAGLVVTVCLTAPPSTAVPRPPAIRAHDAQTVEVPGAVVRVQVTLARPDGAATVRWRTRNGTAVAGSDYVAGSGVLRLTEKRPTRWISVQVLDDGTTEGAETFEVALRKAVGTATKIRIKVKVATVTIAANDGPYPDRLLTVARTGPGSAWVHSEPEIPGLDDCYLRSGTCSATVPHGTAVTLSLEVDSVSSFDGWSSPGCAGTGPCTVLVDKDTTLTADLSRLPGTFRATLTGAGHLSVTGALDDGCDVTATLCEGLIAYGSPDAMVTAHKDDPADVVWWTGDNACAVDVLTCPINGGRELNAHVSPPTVAVTISATGAGNGNVSGPGIACTATAGVVSGDCTESYGVGAQVTLTATPDPGSRVMSFSLAPWCSWSGSATTPVPCQTNVYSDIAGVVRFEP
jgi:hypothetical protein